MDNNDTITLTRKQFEDLAKNLHGRITGIEISQARLPYSPATVSKIVCEVAPNNLGTQKTLQDFLMGACG